jgi:transposase
MATDDLLLRDMGAALERLFVRVQDAEARVTAAEVEITKVHQQNARLQEENARLREENARLREERIGLHRRVHELEGQVAAAQRAARRSAAPHSKGNPVANPKRRGRRSGSEHGRHGHRPVPDHVDRVVEVAVPEVCPDCRGPVEKERIVEQVQEEVPEPRPVVTRFVIEVGRCQNCGRRLQGRHPDQTSDAIGAAGVQLGARAVALATTLQKEYGLSVGKTAAVLREIAGLSVTRGGVVRAIARVGRRCIPTYDALCEAMAKSRVVTADETGWRIGGRSAWLWAFVTATMTVYAIEESREVSVAISVLGLGFAGVLVRDGYAPYRRFVDARHQTCVAHLLRRCHGLLEVARGRGREIPRRVRKLLLDALAIRDQRDSGLLEEGAVRSEVVVLEGRVDALLARPAVRHHENRKLLAHLGRERDHLLTFLRELDVPATNWQGEQAVRPAVVNRKVWGGNRDTAGARTQEMVSSVVRTCRQQRRDPHAVITAMLRSPVPVVAPLLPAPAPP